MCNLYSRSSPLFLMWKKSDEHIWTDEGTEICTMEDTLLTQAGIAEQLYTMVDRPTISNWMGYPYVPHNFK